MERGRGTSAFDVAEGSKSVTETTTRHAAGAVFAILVAVVLGACGSSYDDAAYVRAPSASGEPDHGSAVHGVGEQPA